MAAKQEEKPLPFPDIMEEGVPNLNYDQVRANLQLPIPSGLISQKKQRTKAGKEFSIDYVNVTDLKDILDDRVGIWTALIKSQLVMGNELGVVVSLIIHCSDGQFTQDGNGSCGLNHSSFGDTFSNAYAQAFRRAAEGHGLGRQLWRKHEIRENEYEQSMPQPEQRQVTQSQADAVNAKTSVNPQVQPSKPAQTSNSTEDQMTKAQKAFIENLCKEKQVNQLEYCKTVFDKDFVDLTKKEASSAIKDLSGK